VRQYDDPTPQWVYPATKSDGHSLLPADMPEGARLQLNPDLSEQDIIALGCTGPCLTIARAMQEYGMDLGTRCAAGPLIRGVRTLRRGIHRIR